MFGRVKWLVCGASLLVAMALGVATALGATQANVWIDTNGGTCARSASAVAYADATACLPDAGWKKATAGDLVLMKGGSYGARSFTTKTGAAAPSVLIQPETNASVTFSSLSIVGASYLTLQAPQASTPFLVPGTGGVEFPAHSGGSAATTTFVTLDGFAVNGGYGTTDSLVWINGRNRGITLDHFDVCCTTASESAAAGKLITTDQYHDGSWPPPTPNTDVTIQNSYLHDQVPVEGNPHTECIYASAATGFVVRNTVFRRCTGTGDITFSRTGTPGGIATPYGFVFENNFFGAGYGVGTSVLSRAIDGCWFPGTVFRNNLFEGDIAKTDNGGTCSATHPSGNPAGPITFVNNAGQHGVFCIGTGTYLKNTWTSVRCGSTADNPASASVLASANYAGYTGNSRTQVSAFDLTPSAASLLLDAGATTSFTLTDLYAKTRCPGATSTWTCTAGSETGAAPDVGPAERGAT
jgi:hypothetical protein